MKTVKFHTLQHLLIMVSACQSVAIAFSSLAQAYAYVPFLEHISLPQDGFHEVVETLLNKQRRRLREQERARTQADNDSPTFWQNTATVGAVAVGAAVLLGLRQAFS